MYMPTIFHSKYRVVARFQKIQFRRWTVEEENKLSDAYKQYGPAWSVIAECLPRRKPRECQKHWTEIQIQNENGLYDSLAIIKPYSLDAFISKKDKSTTTLTTVQQMENALRIGGLEKINDQWVQIPIEDPGLSPVERLAKQYVQEQRDIGAIPGRRIWPAQEHKDPWTQEEDMILREAFEAYGPDWKRISYAIPTKRTQEACRYRLTKMFIQLNPIENIDQNS